MKMEDINKFTLSNDSPLFNIENRRSISNNIKIICKYCNQLLLHVKSEPKESWPTLHINCKKIDLTCRCGQVHTIENKLEDLK